MAEGEHINLDAALESLRGVRRILVCPHDDPDPDALAAAWAMVRLLESEVGAEVVIGFGGIIGRAENRAMVKKLGLPLQRLSDIDAAEFDGVVLVDTQPAAGNHSAPTVLPVLACVDHHGRHAEPADDPVWLDVRPDAETTSSIVVGYLIERQRELDSALATAVLYALKTDTRDFTREASERDLEIYRQVLPRADLTALGHIIHPRLEPEYYEGLYRAMSAARVHGRALVTRLDQLRYPDLVAELADFFVRRRGTEWCLCAGLYHDGLRFSIRTEDSRGRAGRVAVGLVGRHGGSAGGHGMAAGGRIPLASGADPSDPDRLWEQLVADFLAAIGEEAAPESFCCSAPETD